ncbi:MAG: LON peptidase substrate-binding domain-containing protein [Solirubrobacterales bacterium]|nr:LON peptidase substrate-binding domain-containing protein [Solirubrobacterales bacterium]
MSVPERDFPLFPLELVALPSEAVPLHIFEERYKTMIGLCLDTDQPFGIVWMADDGLRQVGCACRIEDVLERHDDGRLDILARGTEPFALLERISELDYPAGIVQFLADADEPTDTDALSEAHDTYRQLVTRATEREPAVEEIAQLDSYGMAATVDFGHEAKQGLLELRSENARLALVTRLFRAALKRLDFVDRAQTRARSNGKVRF